VWQFWVDRGGTFTDIVGVRPDGSLQSHKLLSENPEQYKDAAVAGIRELMGLSPTDPFTKNSIQSVKMGTTVATNALLERKGDPTLLLITQGFKDLLRIGYQNRPKLFDLQIQLPDLLYTQVNEVGERLDAEGQVLKAVDLEKAESVLKEAHAQGIRGVAIAFMHAYINPVHEQQVAEIARRLGFTQVSTSHETSKLIKLVGRGDTTVVDAYLSPILKRYVDQVSEALSVGSGACERLFFMQSNGGLTDATVFKGKDSILSGPAGGVVGMVKTAELAGFDKLIGFDMGGTSTDVCHYAGELERSFETEVAGVRMRAPMMNIHTVAAGGGSILTFSDGRYQVGPESAGANPGPACYRRGGPLTVTDCNVMVGKINPEHFPGVFGVNANEALDSAIVKEKFDALAAEIAEQTGAALLSAEEVASGFLRIAIQNMARAIKKISVERGYDITKYTLNCFGGAGGQHACLVADALGMTSVFIHPFAGVLSAYGMGLADIRELEEVQFDKPLEALNDATTVLSQLADKASAAVEAQGVEAHSITVLKRAHLKYVGSHQSLSVEFGDAISMREQFDRAHKARFGFTSPDRALLIEMLSCEAVGLVQGDMSGHVTHTAGANETVQIEMYSDGETQLVPLSERAGLQLADVVVGPAVLTESTGTVVVEAGWQARVDEHANLILERYIEKTRSSAVGTDADPVMLEVFNNLFMSIAEQMGSTLANTAYSVNIKERLDFSCALFDASGNLVANAPHVPVHLGSMSESVKTIAELNKESMLPGNSYLLNAPFNGGTHLPDVTVITPVFDKTGTTIIFFVGSRGHHADIGGKTPGSAPPDSKHIDEEGVVIDNFLLVEKGELREQALRELLGSGRYPCRNINENLADIEAQIAANETGIREIHKMIDQFSLDVVQAYMGHVQNNAEASVRRVIGTLKNATHSYAMDSGATIKVRIEVDNDAQEAVIDFSGTSPQDPGNYNAPLSICHAVVLYVFRTLVGSDIPLNQGCLKPLHIIAPERSMINPVYPAAVIAGNTEVSQSIADCLFAALKVIAGSQGTMNNFVWGNEHLQNYETIAGGTGAGQGFHGVSGVHAHMTNTLMTDPEVLETRFPVRVEKFALREGSAGTGKWNGGEGIHRQLRLLEPMIVTTLCSHRITRPNGGNGGNDGAVGENRVIRVNGDVEPLAGNDACELAAGDIFDMKTPGGGGWGKP